MDDLICNTLGGMLGFVMTPVFVFMLPKHERMDEIAYKRGQVVSEFRRAVAWIIDIVVIIIAFIMSGKMPFMPSQNSFSIFVIVIPFD